MNKTQQSAKHEALACYFGPKVVAVAATADALPAPKPKNRNIIGVGFGVKQTQKNVLTDVESVRVYVRIKAPKHQLTKAELIPAEFNGIPTDVVESGDVVANAIPSYQRLKKHRPAECGISIGHPKITAGTMGCLVQKDGTTYILSNNHVLAHVNKGIVGDNILQPGPQDKGVNPADRIATLSDFEPIDFLEPNEMDAAIAKVINPDDVREAIVEIGKPRRRPKDARLYQSVRKHGRTTGHTLGIVTDVSADIHVDMGGKTAWFEDQIAIESAGKMFSRRGDSGSLIVDAVTRSPTALLFAVGDNITYANPIDKVLDRFNVEVL